MAPRAGGSPTPRLSWRQVLGRAAYGALFCVVAPVGLWFWAQQARVGLPAVQDTPIGLVLALVGALLVALGMVAILVHGGGLPMNAYPPPRLVRRGIYAVLRHPIYAGFVLLCAGVSWVAGSAGGLWLVTPVTALALTALVMGYERDDLRRRFGAEADYAPLLSLPKPIESPPTLVQRIVAPSFVVAAAALVQIVLSLIEAPPGVGDVMPALGGGTVACGDVAVLLHATAYLAPVGVAAFAASQAQLRRWAVGNLWAIAAAGIVYLCLPLTVPVSADWAEASRRLVPPWFPTPAAWLPLSAAVWAVSAAHVLGTPFSRWTLLAWVWALGVALCGALAHIYTFPWVAMAVLCYAAAAVRRRVWRVLLDLAEGLANSWRAWRLGPVRIISHGVFAGLAGAIGLLGAGWLAGPHALWGAVVIGATSLICAGLWAQFIEGSPALLRPFGFYGGVCGVFLGTAIARLAGWDALRLLAAWATMAPWIQAIGRLRCLVQGCCHGRPTTPENGIRVGQPHSRVVKLASLQGQPIHATQLYSVFSNIVIGLFLLQMWSLGAELGLIAGLYIILNGLARFVEEAYRGEPQTPRVAGLAIYQWLAVAGALVGAWATTWPAPRTAAPAAPPTLLLVGAACAMGVICCLAMGVDFPESNRRFARLSG